VSQSGDDRRSEARLSTSIEVDYSAESTFLFAYITDISSMGIFVRTDEPAEVGTELTLRFSLPTQVREAMGEPPGKEPLLLRGRVMWNNRQTGDNRHAGMGVRFVDLSIEDRSVLMDLVRAIAYLDDRDGN
jgi:type IV pilus assembly protein PilZ